MLFLLSLFETGSHYVAQALNLQRSSYLSLLSARMMAWATKSGAELSLRLAWESVPVPKAMCPLGTTTTIGKVPALLQGVKMEPGGRFRSRGRTAAESWDSRSQGRPHGPQGPQHGCGLLVFISRMEPGTRAEAGAARSLCCQGPPHSDD